MWREKATIAHNVEALGANVLRRGPYLRGASFPESSKFLQRKGKGLGGR